MNSLEDEFHFAVTLAVFGDKNSGKSTLIQAMLRHRLKATVLRHETSGPVSYYRASYNHDGVIFLIDIVEIPGENCYKDSLAKFVANGASYSLFCYDSSDPNSLEGCRKWIEAVNTSDAFVVGTKCDIQSEDRVDLDQGWNMANSYGLRSREVSSTVEKNVGVDEIMETFLQHICERLPNPPDPSFMMGLKISIGPKVLGDVTFSAALFGGQ